MTLSGSQHRIALVVNVVDWHGTNRGEWSCHHSRVSHLRGTRDDLAVVQGREAMDGRSR